MSNISGKGIRPGGAFSCRLLLLQVHEQDKRVLQSHSAPLMVNYIYKSTVVQGSLNMDEFCEPIKGEHSAFVSFSMQLQPSKVGRAA